MTLGLDEEFELKTGASFGGMTITPDQVNPIIIVFNLSDWLNFSGQAYDLNDVEGSSIVLAKDSDDEVADQLLESIKENIKGSAKFGKDKDDDGRLGNDEDSDDD